MKCIQLVGSELLEREIPRPEPGAGKVLIRVHAAGVTPSELEWYPTTHTKDGQARGGAMPSHEFSGVIAGVGEGVAGWEIGQEVYGMNDWFADGALAEYCVTDAEWIAVKPKSVGHAEAATVPISSLTALQGLFEHGGLQKGERVLIQGGAGAVGQYAVQMATARVAHVVATVSARDVEFVKEIGADEALDYKGAPFEEAAGKVDVVFDCVGGETLRRSWSVLKPEGRMVTVAAEGERARDEREKMAFFIVEARRKELEEIAKRIDAGELRVVMEAAVPWEQAGEAFLGKVKRSGRGKTAVKVV